jgi:hypothetical protein
MPWREVYPGGLRGISPLRLNRFGGPQSQGDVLSVCKGRHGRRVCRHEVGLLFGNCHASQWMFTPPFTWLMPFGRRLFFEKLAGEGAVGGGA